MQLIHHTFCLNASETEDFFRLSLTSMHLINRTTVGQAMKIMKRMMFSEELPQVSLMDLLDSLTKTFSKPDIYDFLDASPFVLAGKNSLKKFDYFMELVTKQDLDDTIMREALLNLWSRKKSKYVSMEALNDHTRNYQYSKADNDFIPSTNWEVIDDILYGKLRFKKVFCS